MKLTSKQLKRIIAEEVSRVIAEASDNKCRIGTVYDFDRTFEFSVGGKRLSCNMGAYVDETIENIRACASERGVNVDPVSCRNVANEVHKDDFKDTESFKDESFKDTRRQDFISRHYKGPRALLPTTER